MKGYSKLIESEVNGTDSCEAEEDEEGDDKPLQHLCE